MKDGNKKNYLIYKHINKINGKIYVGQTGQNPKKRWSNGKGYEEYYIDENGVKRPTHFWASICKYGWNNFEHKILIHGLTKSQADFWEKKLIEAWDLMNPEKGYNKKEGGSNGKMSEESKIKISESRKGSKNPMYKKFGSQHHNYTKIVCMEESTVYNGFHTVERLKNINGTHICACCKHKDRRKTVGGLHWFYYTEFIEKYPELVNQLKYCDID